jgi:AcrR family transcriptional regulator
VTVPVSSDVSVRERLLASAADITAESGWAAVTMSKVAARAGVSRQTVYNELGTKPALGQAMVLRELERFLAIVERELDAADDLVAAIRSATEHILVMAQGNPLLHALLASAHSVSRGNEPASSNDLLPFLTTDAQPLIAAATEVIDARLDRFPDVDLGPHQRAVAIDTIVRLVLSHVMQPGGSPAATADDLAWIVARVLRR